MRIEFTKMNGAGNDFILIDNRARKLALTPEQAARLCNRHRGVGADGVILLVPCATGKADWAWDFYNSDGTTAEMCGNGSRCFARFVERLTGVKDGLTFETKAGVIQAELRGERVMVRLTAPRHLKLRERVPLAGGTAEIHSVDTGVPHAVLFVPDVDQVMVHALGSEIRHHEHFAPGGTNVNFAQIKDPNTIRVRTYERGVEGETLACGTGVTASALVSAALHGLKSPVRVQVRSGDILEISFDCVEGHFANVGLNGPADFIFEGRVEL